MKDGKHEDIGRRGGGRERERKIEIKKKIQ
jgi:hypothetical protein